MDIIKGLAKSIAILDEIEQEYNEIPKIQSEMDQKLSDIYHFIECSKLNTNQRYRIVSFLQKLLEERRKSKIDWELLRTYKSNESKLSQIDNRSLLMSEIRKREKQLHSNYKYRIYTEELLKEIIGK